MFWQQQTVGNLLGLCWVVAVAARETLTNLFLKSVAGLTGGL
jgi:hypothetical protein